MALTAPCKSAGAQIEFVFSITQLNKTPKLKQKTNIASDPSQGYAK